MSRKVRENILDKRFEGRAITIKLINGETIKGIVDEVSRYEVGLRVRDRPIVIFRHAIANVVISSSDIHGESYEELEENVLDRNFIGYDIVAHLVNGEKIEGRLIKVSRYELGVLSQERAYIIPKSSIIYVEVG
ncbi:MAG TPA: hypothetical protein ENF75_05385 [Acidilobales archaeon]|nr:hypothetical protein [Acidilobales archaeon]